MTTKYPLRPRFEALVQRLVESGRYSCDVEVLDEAMQLLEDRETLREIKLAEINAMIDEGLASAERGELYDAEEVFDELLRDIEAKAAERDAAE